MRKTTLQDKNRLLPSIAAQEIETMESTSPPDLASDFDYAAGKLLEGLRDLHQRTNQEVEFSTLLKGIWESPEEADLAADLTDQFVGDLIDSDKLGHFVKTALAFACRAMRLQDKGDRSAWLHLCQGYFSAGMASVQYNVVRGARLRAESYTPFKKAIVEIAAFHCPPEKWSSLEDMWRSIEDVVVAANELLKGMPGYSKDPKATFDRLTRSRREDFLPFLSGPVKRGRPPKTRHAS